MIDSHCHLGCDAFAADRDAVRARAAARGVDAIVVPAVDERSWEAVLALARGAGIPRCHAALGVHPVYLADLPASEDERLIASLARLVARERPVAIGECGLDTLTNLAAAPLERQEQMLRAHVALAREADLPLVLHARGPGCYSRLLRLLETEALPRAGGVVHSYGGGVGLLPGFLALPLCFGFAGPATYAGARRVRDTLRLVPAERLLAETDAPDQTPEPHRPGRNEPSFLADIVAGIALARGEAPADIARTTAANARRLFRLPD